MYHFCMPIGDWSSDGHGTVENFLVSSNKPVEEVREAHFRIPDVTGIDIEEICSRYEENYIHSDVMEKLLALGWKIEAGMSEFNSPAPEDMANLWVLLLMKTDPSLEMKIAPEERVMLTFYGLDDKSRHIGCVGYGLFE